MTIQAFPCCYFKKLETSSIELRYIFYIPEAGNAIAIKRGVIQVRSKLYYPLLYLFLGPPTTYLSKSIMILTLEYDLIYYYYKKLSQNLQLQSMQTQQKNTIASSYQIVHNSNTETVYEKSHSKTKSLSLPKLSNTTSPVTHHKSVHDKKQSRSSLFKLSNFTGNPSHQKRPLNQFHKVNWSIAPKCLVSGHEGLPVLYVCVDPSCKHLTRLVCQKCFYKEHKMHNQHFLAIDEIKQASVNALRYWPFQSEYRTMYQFIKKHEIYIQNMVQDIKSSFQNFMRVLIKTVKQVQTNYLQKVNKFYMQQTQKSKYVKSLLKDMNECFQMKEIHEAVKKIFTKEVRHDIYMKQLNKVLNKQQPVQLRKRLKQSFQSPQNNKGNDMQFDKIYFLKKQKFIINNIKEQEKALKIQNVVIDQAEVGIQQIIVQLTAYLKKATQPLLDNPISFEKKTFDDGTQYHGFINKGNRSLVGIRDYKNGYIYYGQWKNNCRSGWGVYENKSTGYKYAGNWKEDKKNGFGKQKTLNYQYEGQFANDKKQGFGTIKQDGIRYDITWKNDKKHGKGKRIDDEGETQAYFLNGIQSMVKGSKSGGQQERRDVAFLAKMFAGGN